MKLEKIMTCGIFFVSLFTGCEPKIAIPNDSWGHFTVNVNGKPWERTFKNAYQAVRGTEQDFGDSTCKRVSVYSSLFDSNGVLEEYLYLSDIPAKNGRYKIVADQDLSCSDSTISSSSFVAFIDYDIFRDHYEVLDTKNNFLQIDHYQTSGNREIKGHFEVTFVLKSPRSFNSYEDTLKFTNGKFHTKIVPRRTRHL